MSTDGYVIVALNLFCLLPSLILLVGAGRMQSPLSRLFMWLVALNMLGLLAEAMIWLFEYNSSTLSYYVVRIVDFLNYMAGYGKTVVFGEYLYTCVSRKTAISRKPFKALWIGFFLWTGLLIVSQFNNMYVYFDELNTYYAQDYFFVSQIYNVLGYIALLVITVSYGVYLPKRQLAGLRWYLALLLGCIAVFFIVSTDLVLHFIVGTLSQMILYISVQMDENQQKQLQLAQSRVAVMLSQIEPHFLLNVLTNIGQLCSIDAGRAQTALLHFSRYLRGNMDSLTSKRPIPFSVELEHVKHYLWLESMRFEEKLQVHFDIQARDFLIPALSLQPIVENAVRHGITKKATGGGVHIRSEETATGWSIIVSDDGAGFDPDARLAPGHIGINNVRERLAAMCAGRLVISSVPGQGTTAVIEIPKGKRL